MSDNSVKASVNKNWLQFEGQLRSALLRSFGGIAAQHEHIVGDALLYTLENAATIEKKFDPAFGLPFDGYVYGCLKKTSHWKALERLKKDQKMVAMRDYSDIGKDQGDKPLERLPHSISGPVQEEIVFIKQVLEKFGRLPEYERAALRHVVDRGELSEYCAFCPRFRHIVQLMREGDQTAVMNAFSRAQLEAAELI